MLALLTSKMMKIEKLASKTNLIQYVLSYVSSVDNVLIFSCYCLVGRDGWRSNQFSSRMSLKKHTNNAKEEIHNSYQKPDFELKYFILNEGWTFSIPKICFINQRPDSAKCRKKSITSPGIFFQQAKNTLHMPKKFSLVSYFYCEYFLTRDFWQKYGSIYQNIDIRFAKTPLRTKLTRIEVTFHDSQSDSCIWDIFMAHSFSSVHTTETSSRLSEKKTINTSINESTNPLINQ